MGTALAVSPFNMVPSMLPANKPKVLFNMNNTDKTGGFDFTAEGRVYMEGKCDETLTQLCKDVGWFEDFKKTLPTLHSDKL